MSRLITWTYPLYANWEVRIESYHLPVVELNPFFGEHINRFHTVTHLTLWRISFSAKENLKLQNLPSLTHLALMYCERVDMSFSASDAPNLKSLHYFNKIFFQQQAQGRLQEYMGQPNGAWQ